ncbi:hypothetical protein ANO11243_094100 [Dothideomycetidae sp. 11243]|nr:hypothetical protein ANO11243_094100 [fungal sp. No.11243]
MEWAGLAGLAGGSGRWHLYKTFSSRHIRTLLKSIATTALNIGYIGHSRYQASHDCSSARHHPATELKAGSMSEQRILKRRRVLQACNRCRAMKSKCDGRQPMCGRCEGYGYACHWGEHRDGNGRIMPPVPAQTASALQYSLRAYDRLLMTLRSTATESDQAKIDEEMARARRHLPSDFFETDASTDNEESPTNDSATGDIAGVTLPRYLGKASDLSYINELRVRIRDEYGTNSPDAGPESYDNDEVECSSNAKWSESMLPKRQSVDQLIDIYFTTIHIAYPHISRPVFMVEYDKFWDQRPEAPRPSDAWYAKFCELTISTTFSGMRLIVAVTILAISAYYSSLCPQKYPWLQNDLHARLFSRAATSARNLGSDRPLDQVQILLIQSFYMLATCQTDRCWLILGSAIRIAQSIGLHVTDASDHSNEATSILMREERRRIWYSLFILDRLLSLQLGRPFAVDAADCSVLAPSLSDEDQAAQMDGDGVQSPPPGPRTVDYLQTVMQFSGIIERVVRRLYGAQAPRTTSAKLDAIGLLDAELLDWRANLPRTLRFDLGHTFEKHAVFKRQRNLLAVKFHHLRALIHRPFLGYLNLHNDFALSDATQLDWHRMKSSETICVSEAQKTAHLLHNLPDEESLVHNFPWWQMISCLSCACSILLVAQKVLDASSLAAHGPPDVLAEDATTCISVLEALSTNSKPARLAMTMMRDLRECIQGSKNLPSLARPDNPTLADGLDVDQSSLLLDLAMNTWFSAPFDPKLFSSMPFDTTEVMPWSQNLLWLTNEASAVPETEAVADEQGSI